ncbi:MYB-like transcription factor ETC3 isoform X1 [Prosopis cineraria]|uniref:MYB-like transcription factor ETC3 isoform X1 n=1 Tax=Prosopis cineraria TaxID=364024 RepID=UPI00240F597C|nr:MYB-like transcription factor ETC3 isoform X1 [Prosopis cineraria]XP_054791670.1 MYB-like transcription factor ETC3 isoform X1 [Prosopis cineraria]
MSQQKQTSTLISPPSHQPCFFPFEVSSIEWEFINMSDQEEDLIHRMHRLVGDRWGLIAGRIPGRKAEEIERFWMMTYGEVFASKREQLNRRSSSC